MSKAPAKFLINGVFCDPVDSKNVSYFDIVNPATEEVIVRSPIAQAADVAAAVKAANSAFPTWSRLSASERGKYLRKLADLVEENKERLAILETKNVGKSKGEADWDIGDTSECFRYFAELAEKKAIEEKVKVPDEEFTGVVQHRPLGVVACIVPWNYPLLMATWKLAPALAAGCTIIIKPAECSPLTLLELGLLSQEAKFPPGVLNIITGTGPVTGNALCTNPGIRKLAFTGSVPTGSRVMHCGADSIVPVTLELGGKSAAIVFDDCDMNSTIEWILFGCFSNGGQICSATSRLLLPRSYADAFIPKLVDAAKKIPILDPNNEENLKKTGFIGPLVSRVQYDRVMGYITGAIKEGAEVLVGGKRPDEKKKGFYVCPTILRVKPQMKVWKEEVFGPVLSIMTFENEAEAIQIANETEYGLAGAVFSSNLERCNRVISAMNIGVGWINCSQPCYAQLPWGGRNKSGVGFELGPNGLDIYMAPTSIVSKVDFKKPFGWYEQFKGSESEKKESEAPSSKADQDQPKEQEKLKKAKAASSKKKKQWVQKPKENDP